MTAMHNCMAFCEILKEIKFILAKKKIKFILFEKKKTL